MFQKTTCRLSYLGSKDYMKNKELVHRLNRIIGQIEALKRNLQQEEANDCVQNMQLLKASTNAMKKFGEAYIKRHLSECMQNGDNAKELEENLNQVVRSAFSM